MSSGLSRVVASASLRYSVARRPFRRDVSGWPNADRHTVDAIFGISRSQPARDVLGAQGEHRGIQARFRTAVTARKAATPQAPRDER